MMIAEIKGCVWVRPPFPLDSDLEVLFTKDNEGHLDDHGVASWLRKHDLGDVAEFIEELIQHIHDQESEYREIEAELQSSEDSLRGMTARVKAVKKMVGEDVPNADSARALMDCVSKIKSYIDETLANHG